MPRTEPDISIADLTGKRAVVTGASDGMGVIIATRLAKAGAELVLPVRNRRKGEAAIGTIKAGGHPRNGVAQAPSAWSRRPASSRSSPARNWSASSCTANSSAITCTKG